MAHEIESNKAFFTGQPAWHGLGHVLTDAPTPKEAWRLAYPHSLFDASAEAVVHDSEGNRHALPIPDVKHIIRDDGKYIGTVGKDYETRQPADYFKYVEPFIEQGFGTLEAGGSLKEGRVLWVLLKLKGADADVIKGDHVKGYKLIFTGFDGSLSFGDYDTVTRVVCWNTLSQALNNSSTKRRARHTKNISHKMVDIQQESLKALKQFEHSLEAYQFLAGKRTTRTQQIEYIAETLVPGISQKKNEDVSAQAKNKVQTVIDLLDAQKGLDLVPAARGTAWQAYNAVTEYLTHEHGRTQDSRLNSQWFGESAKTNARALEMAIAL